MNRILIPLDGSEFSGQILGVVRKFFAASGCELVLLHIGGTTEGYTGLPPRPAAAEVSIDMYATGRDAEFAAHPIYETQEEDSKLAALQDELEPVAQTLRAAGYPVTVQAHLGNAAEGILAHADANQIDLVAMTTHGRSGISRLIFGSVAEHVVRHATIPVLVLRPTHENPQ